MPDGELSRVEQAIKAAADTLVNDVVATVRQHPQYGQLVTDLAGKAVDALLSGV
jgi:hypothetical protein